MNLVKYWPDLTMEEKKELLGYVHDRSPQHRGIHLGSLVFVDRVIVASCYVLSRPGTSNRLDCNPLLKKLGVIDVHYNLPTDSMWIEFDDPLYTIKVLPFSWRYNRSDILWDA